MTPKQICLDSNYEILKLDQYETRVNENKKQFKKNNMACLKERESVADKTGNKTGKELKFIQTNAKINQINSFDTFILKDQKGKFWNSHIS